MKPKRETLKEAGYVTAEKIGRKTYLLTDTDGKKEIWIANKGHAGYAIRYRGTDLEFVSSNVERFKS